MEGYEVGAVGAGMLVVLCGCEQHVLDLGVLGERGGFSSDAALAVCWI